MNIVTSLEVFKKLNSEKKALVCLCCSWKIAEILKKKEYYISSKLIKEAVKISYNCIDINLPLFNEVYDFIFPIMNCETFEFINCDLNLIKGLHSSLYSLLYVSWCIEAFQRKKYPEIECHYDSMLLEVGEEYAIDCLNDFMAFSEYTGYSECEKFIDQIIFNYSSNNPDDILNKMIVKNFN